MIGNDWDIVLKDYFSSNEFTLLQKKVDELYSREVCFPPRELVFSALSDTPYSDVRVVILGQDPYHTEGVADGKAFSSNAKVDPPSLRRIKIAVKKDYPDAVFNGGSLYSWAKQGVLLLNTCLSVTKGQANSHRNIGWEEFVENVLRAVSKKGNIIFLLWGRQSISLIDRVGRVNSNIYLEALHPSPLAQKGDDSPLDFTNCHHFAMCNEYLDKKIDFSIR